MHEKTLVLALSTVCVTLAASLDEDKYDTYDQESDGGLLEILMAPVLRGYYFTVSFRPFSHIRCAFVVLFPTFIYIRNIPSSFAEIPHFDVR